MSTKTQDLAPLPAHPASLTRCRARATHEALALADARVAWGGFCPRLRSLGGPHFFVIGETGSGKTILLKLLMYSVLSDKEYDLRYRSLVFDPKGEFLPFLARCGVPSHAIILTNPLDARCSAWDISADITDRADASALAEAIVPTTSPSGDALQGDHLFWNQASNQVVRPVIDGFNARCPGAWDLRDVVLACMNAQHLQTILSLTYAGSCTAKQFLLADKKLAGNILATLAAVMSPLELVANLWHHASSRFSIRDWASGSGVLLLSGSKEHAEITRVANNMLVRSAIQMVLSKPEDKSGDYTWFFLDELRQAGRFPNFSSLL
ncbi:MAG: type IV secretion system DNA-binding domain-containing protein, partial [Phycisphaerales bacterium]|nr:type IV secretion system DNA-binding domain-containing protein [Phycisphaerales bacterium]